METAVGVDGCPTTLVPVVEDALLSSSSSLSAPTDGNQQQGHPSQQCNYAGKENDNDNHDGSSVNPEAAHPSHNEKDPSATMAAPATSRSVNVDSGETNHDNDSKSNNDNDAENDHYHNDNDDNSDDKESSSDTDRQPERDEDDGNDAESINSDNSSESESNVNTDGLSEYERLREERIRRNQQYLAKLGLDQTFKQTVKKPTTDKREKRTSASTNLPDVERRSSLGRASKQKPILYNVDDATNLRKIMASQKATTFDQSRKSKANSKASPQNRVPLEVYKEFVRLGRQRKETFRQFHKYYKTARKILDYWQRRMYRYKADMARQQSRASQEPEQQHLGGKSKLKCWQELDRRSNDLKMVLEAFDKQEAERQQREEEQRLEQEMQQKQIELDRKLELVDAMDRFPVALQETNEMLNNLLLKRAPKDPPPPRRSRRVSLDEHQPSPSQSRAQPTIANNNDSQSVDMAHRQPPRSTLDTIRAALAQKKHRTTGTTSTNTNEQTSSTPPGNDGETRQQHEFSDVGGWVSPPFAESLDRSWLSREKPSEDIATTPPQPGQLFLYYPGAHKAFLVTHPDVWGTRNRTRRPLWEQAATIRDSLLSNPVQDTTITGNTTQLKGRKRRSIKSSAKPIQRAKRQRVVREAIVLQSSIDYNDTTRDQPNETDSTLAAPTSSSPHGRNGGVDLMPSSPGIDAPSLTNAQMMGDSAASSSRRTSTLSKSLLQNNDPPDDQGSSRRRDNRDKEHVIEGPASAPVPVATDDDMDIVPQSTNCNGATSSLSENTQTSPQQDTFWWTDEWIERIDADLGQYPILCRVEHTRAEFPFDQNIDYREVDDQGNLTWMIPDHKQVPYKRKDYETPRAIGLCIVLQPLTAVIPPEWDQTSGVLTNERPLPPKFSVLSFPACDFTPFLVPFAWAYAKNHSLSMGDTVISWNCNDSADNSKSKVAEFTSIGSRWGSFRLDDKVTIIRSIVEQFSSGTLAEIDEALVVSGSNLTTQVSLPPEDAAVIVDFLSLYLSHKSPTNHITQPNSTSRCKLIDFIRSTLPLFQGIGLRREVFHRKVTYAAGWTLRRSKKGKDVFVAQVESYLRERLRQGVPNRLENSLRVKLRYTVENFVINRPEAASFTEMVTEDVAPSYYCAVPVAMHFDRILARLDVSSANDHCYYSSLQAILGDVQTVLDNCLLYNSADSPLVTMCSKLVPALQRQLIHVLSKHENERDALLLADSERKELGLVESLTTMVPEEAADLDTSDASTLATLNTPYKGLLDRSKLQIFRPDSSWQDVSTTNPVFWLPQCGDLVLYSRKSHAHFIEEGTSHLSIHQRILPSFQIGDHGEPGVPSDPFESRWLMAKIVAVHATFPCEAEIVNPGQVPVPVMAVVLHFVDDTAAHFNSVQTLFWPLGASFLRPAWSKQQLPNNLVDDDSVNDSSPIQSLAPSPQGINADSVRRITRILNVLKSRCLNGIDPDFVDSHLSLNNPPNDGKIKGTKPGTRNLSSFEEILSQDSSRLDGKNINTRGIRRTEDDEAIRKLSDALYLPPWTLDTLEDDPKRKKMSNYETMMAFPNLCLELIRLRLKHGYYRQLNGITGDLQEAYLNSTLFILSGVASRRKNRISSKKIAKLLQSENHASSDGDPSSPSDHVVSDEESSLIERLKRARRLYAMAILAVSDTPLLEKILGLYDKQSSLAPPREMGADSTISEMIVAADRIRYLLAAAGSEPCLNQFNKHGSVKLKIIANGKFIKYKDARDPSPRTFISLGHNEYTSNDSLARVMLRRPGRRAPCIRCQVYGLPFYTCRVIRCHSNPDFDFVANWTEVGGIDGLLQPFRALQSSLGISQCALVHESTSSHTPHPTGDNGVLEDPTDDLEKAQRAVKLAASLEKKASVLALEPTKLSTKFIQDTFPVDPSDGHYLWCTICGLSGDVLCCDGCSNVVHSKCIGLSNIPEDDWFCNDCVSKLPAPKIIHDPSSAGNKSPSVLGTTTVAANAAAPLPLPHNQKKVSVTDAEFEAEVGKLGQLIEELDRKHSMSGRLSQINVGTVFYKTFSTFGRFRGVVVATPTESHPFCKVEYEDGDTEELEPLEIVNLLRENSHSAPAKSVQAVGNGLGEGDGRKASRSGANAQRPRKNTPGEVVQEVAQASTIIAMGTKDGTVENKDYALAESEGQDLRPKKKRGRPSKYRPPEDSHVPSRKAAINAIGNRNGSVENEAYALAEKAKKKRGRPRKYVHEASQKAVINDIGKNGSVQSEDYAMAGKSEGQVLQPKKKRGRPNKYSPREDVHEPSQKAAMNVMGKDGRVENKGQDLQPKKKRGRPSKYRPREDVHKASQKAITNVVGNNDGSVENEDYALAEKSEGQDSRPKKRTRRPRKNPPSDGENRMVNILAPTKGVRGTSNKNSTDTDVKVVMLTTRAKRVRASSISGRISEPASPNARRSTSQRRRKP